MGTDYKPEQNALEQGIPGKTAEQQGAEGKSAWTAKRVAAIIGIVLLVGLYLLTLVSAIIGTEGSGRLFRFSLGMTIAVPIFLWIFLWCLGKFHE